jgi:hypothetical protein
MASSRTSSKGTPQHSSSPRASSPRASASIPASSSTPRAWLSRALSFGRGRKKKKEVKPDQAAAPAHDGRLVGEDVVLLNVECGLQELAGMRAEAILYDFYEQLYTCVLDLNGRRVQVPPNAIRKVGVRL